MRRNLLKIAAHYQPHLILLGHTDTLDQQTIASLRSAAPNACLAQFIVDHVDRPKTMASFRNRAEIVDQSFITTADKAELQALNLRENTILFMPNPVDASIEAARTYQKSRENL